MEKSIVFNKRNGGGSYQLLVFGDTNKETWGKLDGETVVDYHAKAIAVDAKKDGYKIIWKQ